MLMANCKNLGNWHKGPRHSCPPPCVTTAPVGSTGAVVTPLVRLSGVCVSDLTRLLKVICEQAAFPNLVTLVTDPLIAAVEAHTRSTVFAR